MNKFLLTFTLLMGIFFQMTAQTTTATFGAGTSSSASRGPMQVSGGTSTTTVTAFNQVYTAAELSAAGLTAANIITELQWDLNSTNVIQGAGNATFTIYMKNSSATSATADTWGNTIAGSTVVLDRVFNTTDNFPGAKGYMSFPLTTPFDYTGGALEIAVLWDMSGITADPAGGTQAFNNPDGSSDPGTIKWRWSATTGTNLVSKKTSSSSISSGSSLSLANEERANINILYTGGPQTATFGTGTSSSASRGPMQVSGGTSTTVVTAFNQVYTASELAANGVASGNTITELLWDLNTINVIQGAGDATFTIYMKNSSATVATADTWGNTIAGSTMVLDRVFNTTNNFPGVKGYMAFPLTTPFAYTGGALEIAVLWDMSGITADPAGGTQAFNNPEGSGDAGTIKWRYSTTTGFAASVNLVTKKTSSSTITSGSSLALANQERANMQIVHEAILPVELTYFQGKVQNKTNALSWQTQTEENNDYFEVQHSTNGREFSTLDKVAGNGTTSDVQNYNYTHKNVTSSDNYYRLKQVDFDGEFEYSDIIYLQNDTRDTPVAIYPNPARELITYEGTAATLTFFDIQGRRVMQQTAINTGTAIDISTLRSGVYTIEILTNSGERTFEKLIKE